ncbi:MAG: YgcG family protein [Nitrosomonas sp.]|nr:YgcG family protein [Nitrosomonas sp.]
MLSLRCFTAWFSCLGRNHLLSSGILPTWVRAWVLLVLLLMTTGSQADIAIPPLKSHVTDLTSTLSAQEVARLEQRLAAFEQKKGSQVAVLLVPTTRPETIEQYAMRVAEAWKLGRKGIDDGALLLIAKNDRGLRIEVGYGLEGVLPDAKAKRIIEEIIAPRFKAGDFTGGIHAGVDAILGLIEGEALPSPSAQRGTPHALSADTLLDNIVFIFIGFMVFGRLFQALFGRLAGATVTSIGAGLIGWLLFSSMAAAILIAIAAFFMGLFQQTGGGIYRNGRGHWIGHDSSGHMGRGGFGGGFGGGGGGFGGGGASGRW